MVDTFSAQGELKQPKGEYEFNGKTTNTSHYLTIRLIEQFFISLATKFFATVNCVDGICCDFKSKTMCNFYDNPSLNDCYPYHCPSECGSSDVECTESICCDLEATQESW
jgi:hypothetical protein